MKLDDIAKAVGKMRSDIVPTQSEVSIVRETVYSKIRVVLDDEISESTLNYSINLLKAVDKMCSMVEAFIED